MQWFSRRHKHYMMLSGVGLALLGALMSMAANGLKWEENLGLDLLFSLRGERSAPEDVVIVSLDRQSARALDLPLEPQKWPRSIHARLVNTLKEKGASVVVFDVVFREKRDPVDDLMLSQAIQDAGNTVLCEYLRKDRMPWDVDKSGPSGLLDIEHAIPPIPELKRAAIASAPFPLPQKPYRVNQYWAFKPGAGEQPTLPVVAFQVFAQKELPALLNMIQLSPASSGKNFRFEDWKGLGMEHRIRRLREWFRSAPAEWSSAGGPTFPASRLLHSLIELYKGPDSRYLNFYGPAGTIATLSYHQVIQDRLPDPRFTLEGKAVFIGLSERFRTEQRDDFFTVFSDQTGPDMSGVEIAATAFGNLLEGRQVVPVPPAVHLGIIAAWGLLLGIVCVCFRPPVSLSIASGLILTYLISVQLMFTRHDLWAPVVVPLTVQAPIALSISLFLAYRHIKEERRRITKAASYYLPEQVVADLSSSDSDMSDRQTTAYGVCLVTDAAQYSRLSERLPPEQLSKLLNQYYEAIFKPVKVRGGLISDIIGDSMMAIWASPPAESVDKKQACLAALDILESVDRFNRSHQDIQLPTRIGLHAGNLVIGNVGAVDHFEYRAVGDVVNSASRLEGLNKHLGTRILLSGEVTTGTGGLNTRYVGRFLPHGKRSHLSVFELIRYRDTERPHHRRLLETFAEALLLFETGRWTEALSAFSRCLDIDRDDGPSAFYLNRCEGYVKNPPDAPVKAVSMSEK
jgi:adenylate cyclase